MKHYIKLVVRLSNRYRTKNYKTELECPECQFIAALSKPKDISRSLHFHKFRDFNRTFGTKSKWVATYCKNNSEWYSKSVKMTFRSMF